MTTIDFRPTTTELARLVRSVDDQQLGGPTPCPDYSVADLLDHIGGLALAFTLSARKEEVPGGGNASGDGSRLEEGWRDRISAQLGELGEAWLEPAAYQGMTMAGPVEMPGEVAALVALDEVTVHAWDLAVATGQPAELPGPVAAAAMDASREIVDDELRPGRFAPEQAPPEGASQTQRLASFLGRST